MRTRFHRETFNRQGCGVGRREGSACETRYLPWSISPDGNRTISDRSSDKKLSAARTQEDVCSFACETFHSSGPPGLGEITRRATAVDKLSFLWLIHRHCDYVRSAVRPWFENDGHPRKRVAPHVTRKGGAGFPYDATMT